MGRSCQRINSDIVECKEAGFYGLADAGWGINSDIVECKVLNSYASSASPSSELIVT